MAPDGDIADEQNLTALPETTSRLLAALLAVADKRRTPALVETVQPPLAVVNLPNSSAGVLLLDRANADPETLKRRLDQLVSLPSGAVLHLVLVGGSAADRPLLEEADRNARNPNRLGVHHLDDSGRLVHVRGRRLGLLPAAAKLLPTTAPLQPGAIAAAAERARQAQAEALAFATKLGQQRPIATWVLCAACLLMFMGQTTWGRAVGFDTAAERMGANVPALVSAGEPWRLLSYAFLHGSMLHLLMNGFALFSFGGFLERLIGWRRYVLLYAATALAGGLASAFIGRPDSSVGASGAIWGLMAAGLALAGPRQTLLPGLVAAQLRPRLMTILFINVAISFVPGIDLYAHFGGGLLGFVLVASGWLTRGLPDDGLPVRVSAWVAVALMAVSVALAIITGRPWSQTAL